MKASDPHDNDAERALLGAILSDGSVLPAIRADLAPGDFYAQGHGKIFDAAISLLSDGQAVDHITLTERLKARGQLASVGGPAYLMNLDSAVPLAVNAREYAKIIRDRSTRRKLLAIGRRLLELSVDLEQNPGEVQGKAASAISRVSSGAYTLRSLSEIFDGIQTHLFDVEDGRADPVVPTGIRVLDDVIGGLQATLTVVGARTGVGKSAFASTVIQNVARYFSARQQGHKVGVFSLEDEGEWLGFRYLAAASGVNGFSLRHRKKTELQWTAIAESWGHLKSYSDLVLVDDRPSLSSWELAQSADDMIVNRGVRVIVIDHLQEVNHWAHKRDTLEQNMTASLGDLRNIAKRHNVPVLLLCQMLEDEKTKPGDFMGARGFYGARETVKKSRVALELAREPGSDTMKLRVLKQTNGVGQTDLEVRFIGAAAMIADVEGHQGALEFEPPAPSIPTPSPPSGPRHLRSVNYTPDPDRENET